MKYFIITGTSRGIGEAFAYELLKPEHRLFCISRSPNAPLELDAIEANCRLSYIRQDLAQTFDAAHLMGVLLSKIQQDEVEEITLIHNAGVLEPIGAVGTEVSEEEVVRGVNVNMLAPMLMTEAFANVVQDWACKKRVLLISSGAARHPYYAWSTYCASKAGAEMFCQCMSLEQSTQKHPIRVVSIAPGIVDTEMQTIIRKQTKETFPLVDRFVQYKETGSLWTANFVAKHIVQLFEDEDFWKIPVRELRDIIG